MDFLSTSSKRAKLKSFLYFFGTAAIAGILCNLLLFRLYSPVHVPIASNPVIPPLQCAESSLPIMSKSNALHWEALPQRSVDQLKAVVATTNGYYARDWSLGLGWNNECIRYILETALLHAQLLNRTLIVPSFVYARACEYDIHVCEAYARMVNRNDAVGSSEWRELPMEKQMAWRLPLEVMIDIPHLRTIQPLITVSEYLRIRGVSTQMEWSDGKWGNDEYHRPGDFVSNFTIDSTEYDPEGTVRVDDYEPDPWTTTSTVGLQANQVLRLRLEALKTPQMALAEARAAISSVHNVTDPATLYDVIHDAGWVPLHTFDGALNMDFVKWVVKPRVDVAPRDVVKGFVQEYRNVKAELLVLKGEIHLYRKPGSMRFMTIEKARKFASLVLYDMRVTPVVQALAGRITHRIDSITEGRLWVAAHMRRGDFVRYGWAMADTIEEHFKRIQEKLQRGRETIRYLRNSKHSTYDVPNPRVNELVQRREPPRNSDPFYLATDERDPIAIEYLRNNSAILLKDILTLQDRREIGWPLMFTDVAALVEQTVMAHGAGFFYGHGLSSVVGGVVNQRAGAGWDPLTALID